MARPLEKADEQLLAMIQEQCKHLEAFMQEQSPELLAETQEGRKRLRSRHLEEMSAVDAAAVIAASLFAASLHVSQTFQDQPEEALARLRSAALLTAAELADLRADLAKEAETEQAKRWANRGGYL